MSRMGQKRRSGEESDAKSPHADVQQAPKGA